jgi:hypothetical protein
MATASTTTEFIFFHVPETIIPEDPQNAEGKRLTEILKSAKSKDGYCWSVWGRTEEDPNAFIWVIGKLQLSSSWATARSAQPTGIDCKAMEQNGQTTPRLS